LKDNSSLHNNIIIEEFKNLYFATHDGKSSKNPNFNLYYHQIDKILRAIGHPSKSDYGISMRSVLSLFFSYLKNKVNLPQIQKSMNILKKLQWKFPILNVVFLVILRVQNKLLIF
jgi:hypothetical protein